MIFFPPFSSTRRRLPEGAAWWGARPGRHPRGRAPAWAKPSSLCVAIALAVAPRGGAFALEPRSTSEPDVLREPADVTRVVDAWADGGGMDLHFSLGYQHTWRRSTIARETQDPEVDPRARIGTVAVPIAKYAENTSRLNIRADLGLYRDLALILRVPIVLSSSATLEGRTSSAAALDGAPGSALFTLPFGSPNRSGVEYLGVGVDWGILNQGRDGQLPSLLVGAEARLSVSEPMHACGPGPAEPGESRGSTRCTYPADIDRDGAGGGYPVTLASGTLASLEGELPSEPRRAGVSRGTTAIELHAAMSRRFAQLEPYVAFGALFELPDDASDFMANRPFADGPPVQGRVSLGAEFMPWELVEQYQRLSIDVRLTGTYRSEGQDYSELFDALGSSPAPTYRRPNFGGYVENPDPSSRAAVPSVVDASSERVFPAGLTRVEAHGAYALRLAARWQAGQYVHFDVGGALAFTQQHFITLGRPCDASRPIEPENAGPCASGAYGPGVLGAPDPSYRPETDQPGQRFLVDTAHSFDTWVGATVMF